jgi:hypothetical protein
MLGLGTGRYEGHVKFLLQDNTKRNDTIGVLQMDNSGREN